MQPHEATSKKFPPAISALLQSLDKRLPHFLKLAVFAHSTRSRGMRSDFARNMKSVLLFLVRHYDLGSRLVVRRCAPNTYATVTPGMIAQELQLSTKTVFRIFKYLTELGILESGKQQIVTVKVPNGKWLLFTSCVRKLTSKLWSLTGLLSLWQTATKNRAIEQINAIRRAVVKKFFAEENAPEAQAIRQLSLLDCRLKRRRS